jgi:ABC-type glucose/galactose transport system permease subunit
MESWRTLLETMGVALTDIANEFGYTGETAKSQLYSALQDGTITFDEFNKTLINLDQGLSTVNGSFVSFADRALTASEGIGTSMQNIRTAVVTGLGRYVLAVGGNREASKVCGINPNAITMGVFVITGICVAIAAVIFTGRAASAQPTAGAGMEMDAIAAVVIGGTPLTGGKGKVVGTIIGCVIIGVINNGLNLLEINTNWQIIVKGLMILIAVLIDIQFSKIGARRRK